MLSVLLFLCCAAAADDVTYEEHLLPILRSECLTCHNPDKKKAGLDLSTYQGAMAGSSGGPVIVPGDPDGSLLYKVVMHLEEPYMPRGRTDLLPQTTLDVFKRWIAGGALERAGSKPAPSKKPRVDLGAVAIANGKPAEPPPLPADLVLEPIVKTPRPGAVRALATNPWSPVCALAGEHQVLLYHTQSLELLGVLPFEDGEPQVLAFSQSGRVLLAGGGQAAKSGHVELFDVASGERVARLGEEFDQVLAADLSPDQSLVALGGPGKTVKVYSVADQKLLHTMKKHTDWVSAIAFSKDGVLLATADRAGGLVVWEAKSGQEFATLPGHKLAITALAFRDDSNVLASASEDGTVKLWDMNSSAEVKSWQAHPGGVRAVSFAHDGRLATAGRDHAVRAWKPDGAKLRDLEAMPDMALFAAFDHEGKRIVAGDWSGAVRVSSADDGQAIGTLALAPPTIAERLDAANRRLADLTAARDEIGPPAPDQEAQIRAVQIAIAKLGAARFNLTVQAARREVAAREQDLDRAASTAEGVRAQLEQAKQDAAAVQQLIAGGPARVQAKEAAIAKAKELLAAAETSARAAATWVAEREAMLAQSTDLVGKLSAAAAGAPDDKNLADGAAKAKAALEPVKAALETARQQAAARAEEVKRAGEQVAAAEAALASERDAIAQLPARATAAAALASQRAHELEQTDAPVAAAKSALDAAKAKLDQLVGEYHRMMKEAEEPEPASTAGRTS